MATVIRLNNRDETEIHTDAEYHDVKAGVEQALRDNELFEISGSDGEAIAVLPQSIAFVQRR
jgi:hypothetical protein